MPCCDATGGGGLRVRLVMVRAEEQDLSPAMSRHIKALKTEIDHGIRRLIREGMQDGSIHACDPKMTAFALAGRSTGSPTGTVRTSP